jgi:parallel beta-helix repeat protein
LTRKTLLGLLLILSLAGLTFSTFQVKTAKAQSRIYILSEGLVESSNAAIQHAGSMYQLTADLNAEIIVQKSNIVIDGNGHSLLAEGMAERGIYLSGLTNVTIQNLGVSGFRYAIYIENSSFNVVQGNRLSNQGDGIVLDPNSNNNTISRNTINGTQYNSLFLGESSGNTISYNNIIFTANILDSYQASNNRIYGNRVLNYSGYIGFGLGEESDNNLIYSNEGGSAIIHGSSNQIFGNNFANTIALVGPYLGGGVWLPSMYNRVFSNNATGIDLSYAFYNELYGNTINGPFTGISIDGGNSSFNNIHENRITATTGISVGGLNLGSQNNTIQANTIQAREKGIDVGNAPGTMVLGNRIQTENATGIFLLSDYGISLNIFVLGNAIANCKRAISLQLLANGDVISGNTLTSNHYGIIIFGVSNNTIRGNYIAGNVYGVYSQEGIYGEHVYSSNNTITGNVITASSSVGVCFSNSSQQNLIYGNNITKNKVGVSIGEDSPRNTFYGNNFVANEADVNIFPWRDNWNSTYLDGGNYWSNYTGTDNRSGPEQDMLGNDGIGDKKYPIDANNNDYYPLMAPVIVPEPDVPPAIPELSSPIVVLFVTVATLTVVAFSKRQQDMCV